MGLGSTKCAALFAAAATAGCAYSPAGAPQSAAPVLSTAARPYAGPLARYATLVPENTPRAKYYEYIDNNYTTYASIFDYPKGTSQVGSIENVGGQACTNVLSGYGKKTFWIVAGPKQISEYAAPKKLLKTLSAAFASMSSCAMNREGDLAVGVLSGRGGGDVVIFHAGTGSGTTFTTPLSEEYFDGYDPKGDLFADGFYIYTHSGKFGLVELPAGSTEFERITTSNNVAFAGSVQWDGKYLTVDDQNDNNIYRYTVQGTTAVLKGTVSLEASDCAQTWIAGDLVYCADAGSNDGEVFKYPEGGAPIAVFTGNFDLPLGTVAVKK